MLKIYWQDSDVLGYAVRFYRLECTVCNRYLNIIFPYTNSYYTEDEVIDAQVNSIRQYGCFHELDEKVEVDYLVAINKV